jgi:hypothetical protein
MAMRFGENKKSFLIDLSADPFVVPPGFEVVEHIKGDFLNWIPNRPPIELYLTPDQRKGIVEGAKLLEDLDKYEGTMANANALDYLFEHLTAAPWIIPDDWKNVEQHRSKHILFWGTRYRHEGSLCVRTLEWNADAREQVWRTGYCWIDNRMNSQFPAAMVRKQAPAPAPPAPAKAEA